ncbi:hypothetical protein HPP92_028381, partial [Vanilla planifolia]
VSIGVIVHTLALGGKPNLDGVLYNELLNWAWVVSKNKKACLPAIDIVYWL